MEKYLTTQLQTQTITQIYKTRYYHKPYYYLIEKCSL